MTTASASSAPGSSAPAWASPCAAPGMPWSLADPSPTAVRAGPRPGAGAVAAADDPAPDLVVVAAPPDVAADVVADELRRVAGRRRHRRRLGQGRRARRRARGAAPTSPATSGRTRWPGRERSGAVAARGDLFDGRAWVVVPHRASRPPSAVAAVTRSWPLRPAAPCASMDPAEHDAAVAVSRTCPSSPPASSPAGCATSPTRRWPWPGRGCATSPGSRPATRSCGPRSWRATPPPCATCSPTCATDLDRGRSAPSTTLADGDGVGRPRGAGRGSSAQGNAGHARIPGKHGAAPTAYSVVVVARPRRAGRARPAAHDVGDAGVNLEDLHLEHGLGQPFGLAEVAVLPGVAERLGAALERPGLATARLSAATPMRL